MEGIVIVAFSAVGFLSGHVISKHRRAKRRKAREAARAKAEIGRARQILLDSRRDAGEDEWASGVMAAAYARQSSIYAGLGIPYSMVYARLQPVPMAPKTTSVASTDP